MPSLDEARKLAEKRSNEKNARNAFYYDKHRKDYDIQKGDFVYCKFKSGANKEKLESFCVGPIKVVDKVSDSIFRVNYEGRFRDVHKDNIRVAAADRY